MESLQQVQDRLAALETLSGLLRSKTGGNDTLTLQGNLTDSVGNRGANVIGGFGGSSGVIGNSVASGVVGATIAGGGGFNFNYGVSAPNTVTADWGTVGGGRLEHGRRRAVDRGRRF